jgi:hypothetical protein
MLQLKVEIEALKSDKKSTEEETTEVEENSLETEKVENTSENN